MAHPETRMRRRVVEILKASELDPQAVENACGPGTPDINYTGGWIELKQLESWPARGETIVALRHFTAQQRVWLSRRYARGGRAFLLLRVGDEWLLFSGKDAAQFVGRSTREGLMHICIAHWATSTAMAKQLPGFLD